jgi:hypothetical protein
MVWVWTGILIFAANAADFWFSLPVNGKVRPFVNTSSGAVCLHLVRRRSRAEHGIVCEMRS